MFFESSERTLVSPLWLVFYLAILFLPAFYIFNRWFSDLYRIRKYRSKGHSWRSVQSNTGMPHDNLCSVCRKLILPTTGYYCERCGLSSCRKCERNAEKKQPCRVVSTATMEPFLHHWVKIGTVCEDCHTLTDETGNDFFCCWCHKSYHSDDKKPPVNEVCDYGEMRNVVIPPSNISIKSRVIAITPLKNKTWKPVILIGNPVSGGGAGDEVLSLFSGYLNPIQVIRLDKRALQSLLSWIPSEARIIVAGGDGSVSMVLTAIANTKGKVSTPVGVLPLGTGNDLSRVLGWGGTCPNPLNPISYFKDIENAVPQNIDRWLVQIGRRKLYAYNYFSIGVDARVALDFHKARLHPLYVRGSQWVNYFMYLCYGTQQVLSQDCHGLEKLLEVTLDGEKVSLPGLQALLFLNIPSWGAGIDVWNLGADSGTPRQSYNDGILEVLGINSSFHIAQLQVGLSQPNRISQASKVLVKLKSLAPMQIDGEPWEQGPSEIQIQWAGHVSVLCRASNSTE